MLCDSAGADVGNGRGGDDGDSGCGGFERVVVELMVMAVVTMAVMVVV